MRIDGEGDLYRRRIFFRNEKLVLKMHYPRMFRRFRCCSRRSLFGLGTAASRMGIVPKDVDPRSTSLHQQDFPLLIRSDTSVASDARVKLFSLVRRTD